MACESPYDVIVIGGGPAGSTAATFLAKAGRSVLLLEKEKFPRYHVGESLMPFCYFTLERLGVIDQLKQSGYPRKLSVQFARQDGTVSQPFYFFQHFDHEASTTWQVRRSEFDSMLLDNARAHGVTVWEEAAVERLLEEEGRVCGVEFADSAGRVQPIQARVTIDASGRDGLTIKRRRWRKRDPKLNKVAIWTYYRGARRDEGLDAGATTVAYLEGKGWFWYIPMADDIVSVGVVAERAYLYRNSRHPAEIMNGEVPNNAWIRDHLSTGRQFGRYWVTGEYSYRSEYCADDGLVLCGDAFAFLDPVFSSGVFLALWSGEQVARAVNEGLERNDVSGEKFRSYGENLCRGIEAMRKLVYAFYSIGFSFRALITKFPEVRGNLTDCLIGNLFSRDYPELFRALGDFAEIPVELDYGQGPFVGAMTERCETRSADRS